MKKEYRFYKTEENRWYVDLPSYIEQGGSIEELEMVLGADLFLDILSLNKDQITLVIDDKYFTGAYELTKSKNQDVISGAVYEINHIMFGFLQMWLCDVTKFIFNDFPNKIYFSPK